MIIVVENSQVQSTVDIREELFDSQVMFHILSVGSPCFISIELSLPKRKEKIRHFSTGGAKP